MAESLAVASNVLNVSRFTKKAIKKRPSGQKMSATEVSMTTLIRNSAMAFIAADLNSDSRLDFNEFLKVIPENTREQHGSADLHELFRQADADGNGSISKDEFFFWSLEWSMCYSAGRCIDAVFKRFDESGDGELNLLEFTKLADNFGYGSIGHDLFMALDVSGDGKISYQELLASLKKRRGTYSPQIQRLLVTMSFDMERATDDDLGAGIDAIDFDTSTWEPSDPDDVRSELRSRMNAVLARPFHVWCAILQAVPVPLSTHSINFEQFKQGISKGFGCGIQQAAAPAHGSRGPGYKRGGSVTASRLSCNGAGGPSPLSSSPLRANDQRGQRAQSVEAALSATFRDIDEMSESYGTGNVICEDLIRWLNGNVIATQRVAGMSFANRVRKRGFDTPLEDIVWTPEAVRLELQRMLLSGTPPLSPLDLMLAHDKSDDCMLNRSEFVVMFKKLVGSEKVWGSTNVKETITKLFERISGEDAEVSIEELQQWIAKGWMNAKLAIAQERVAELKGLVGSGAHHLCHVSTLSELEELAAAEQAAGGATSEDEESATVWQPASDATPQVPRIPSQDEAMLDELSRSSTMLDEVSRSSRTSSSSTRTASRASRDQPGSGSSPSITSTPRAVSIRSLFRLIDTNGDGKINKKEVGAVAQQLGCNPRTFWALLLKYDLDGDGYLQEEEFECAIKGRVLSAFFPNVSDAELVHEISRAAAEISRST